MSNPLLYKSITPIHNKEHLEFGFTAPKTYSFAKALHAAPLHAKEVPAAASNYPIIFAGSDNLPAAALGLEEGQNLFLDENDNWNPETYIPDFLSRYPFILAAPSNQEDPEKLLCFDSDTNSISKAPFDIPFYTDGQLSDNMQQVLLICTQHEQLTEATKSMTKQINDFGLMATHTLKYKHNNEDKSISYTGIDEKKFTSLDDDKFLELRSTGALQLIYAQLLSTASWNNLLNRVANT